MVRFYIVFFTLLTLFSLYATLYGSFLDKVSYHYKENHSRSSSSSSHTYFHSSRSSSSSHSYGNGGYSFGK